jgi:polysaccharide deacetylase 2 family uncharacterized protein YibQ
VRKIISFLALFLGFTFGCYSSSVVIVIDDIGNKVEEKGVFSLPNEVTLAILPHTPFASPFAQKAQQQNREVILHVPMESLAGRRLGPGALKASMTPEEIFHTLDRAMDTVPNALGINNHMGSKLTQLTLHMSSIMDYLNDRQMYFLDSRTTRFSKGESIANQYGVPSKHRHVFLDNNVSSKSIEYQFQKLIRLAKKKGEAIGIAHPYPASIKFLQENLPRLNKQGIKLVPLSQIMPNPYLQLAKKDHKQPAITPVEQIAPLE